MTNDNLPRSTKRKYLTKTSFYKNMSYLRFDHPTRVAHREMMRIQGNEIHQKNIESVQRELAESLAPAENKMIDLLKSKKLDKSEIDSYMEKWVNVNFWPKPNNYHETRRELKKLNKKHSI